MIVHWSQKFLLCKHDIDIETALVLQKTIPHLNSYFVWRSLMKIYQIVHSTEI